MRQDADPPHNSADVDFDRERRSTATPRRRCADGAPLIEIALQAGDHQVLGWVPTRLLTYFSTSCS